MKKVLHTKHITISFVSEVCMLQHVWCAVHTLFTTAHALYMHVYIQCTLYMENLKLTNNSVQDQDTLTPTQIT